MCVCCICVRGHKPVVRCSLLLRVLSSSLDYSRPAIRTDPLDYSDASSSAASEGEPVCVHPCVSYVRGGATDLGSVESGKTRGAADHGVSSLVSTQTAPSLCTGWWMVGWSIQHTASVFWRLLAICIRGL